MRQKFAELQWWFLRNFFVILRLFMPFFDICRKSVKKIYVKWCKKTTFIVNLLLGVCFCDDQKLWRQIVKISKKLRNFFFLKKLFFTINLRQKTPFFVVFRLLSPFGVTFDTNVTKIGFPFKIERNWGQIKTKTNIINKSFIVIVNEEMKIKNFKINKTRN